MQPARSPIPSPAVTTKADTKDIMNQENRAAIAPKHYQTGLFDNSEVIEELVDSILVGLKRDGVNPQEFLMRLLVRETSEKLQKLPKHLQHAAIALLAEQFLGDGDTSDLVRGDADG